MRASFSTRLIFENPLRPRKSGSSRRPKPRSRPKSRSPMPRRKKSSRSAKPMKLTCVTPKPHHGVKKSPGPRQPADVSEAESHIEAIAPPEERYIGRRPNRVITPASVNAHWPRPPRPVSAVNEPSAIVIRRPAPRFIRYPRPTVVRLPDPISIAIRRPARILIRNPDLAVIRDVFPVAMSVEILRPSVIAVRMLPAPRVLNRAIAVFIPLIEIVFRRRIQCLILRIVRALNVNHLPAFNACAALRLGHFRLPPADNHLRVGIAIHLNAVVSVPQRMHGRVGSINFSVGLAVLKYAVFHQPLADLHLNVRTRQVGDFNRRIFVQANHVGIVELNFRAPAVPCRNSVASLQRRIDRRRNPVARVASLHGNVALNRTEPRDRRLHLRIVLVLPLIGRTLNLRVLILRILIRILRMGRPSRSGHREQNRGEYSEILFHDSSPPAGTPVETEYLQPF